MTLFATLDPTEAIAVAAAVVAVMVGLTGFRDRRSRIYREERDAERERADSLSERISALEGELRARPDLAGVVAQITASVAKLAEQSAAQWQSHDANADVRARQLVEALEGHDRRMNDAYGRLAKTLEVQTEILRRLANGNGGR